MFCDNSKNGKAFSVASWLVFFPNRTQHRLPDSVSERTEEGKAGSPRKDKTSGDILREESEIVIRSLRVNTLSKLTFDDAKIFNGIVADVFPSLATTDVESPDLTAAVKECMAKLKLQVMDTQIYKILHPRLCCWLFRTGHTQQSKRDVSGASPLIWTQIVFLRVCAFQNFWTHLQTFGFPNTFDPQGLLACGIFPTDV